MLRRALMVLTLLAVPAVPGAGGPREAGTAPAVLALERHLDQNFTGRKIPGAAMAVIQDGRVVMARGFGSTRAKGGEGVGSGTLFRLGSTTKMFVAATALTLVEDGRLDLNRRPISSYVPRPRAWISSSSATSDTATG